MQKNDLGSNRQDKHEFIVTDICTDHKVIVYNL